VQPMPVPQSQSIEALSKRLEPPATPRLKRGARSSRLWTARPGQSWSCWKTGGRASPRRSSDFARIIEPSWPPRPQRRCRTAREASVNVRLPPLAVLVKRLTVYVQDGHILWDRNIPPPRAWRGVLVARLIQSLANRKPVTAFVTRS
jgi:hypothetical protein